MADVTIAIPTFNAAQTLRVCLDKLQLQRIPNLKVFIYDNGSVDGTVGMLSELAATRFYAMKPALDKYTLDITFFAGQHDPTKSGYENGLLTRQKIAKMVNTEFLFLLDPDVLLSPNAIPQLLDDFLKEPDCGFMGIKYEPDAGHVMLGATIWRTKVFREVGTWDGKEGGCDCNFCANEMKRKNLKVLQHKELMAYHYKHF